MTNVVLKGTVSREKLLNWGLGEMDWTLTIDRTWVLHFTDQLFNCYNFLTVCRLDVKPVLWFPAIDAFCRLIMHAVFAVRCLLVCGLQASNATPPPCPQPLQARHCIPLPPTTTCLIHPPSRWPWHSAYTHTAHLLCCLGSPLPNTVLLLQSAQYYGADCNNRTLIKAWISCFLR